jgi:hypothetical protein
MPCAGLHVFSASFDLRDIGFGAGSSSISTVPGLFL